MNEFWNRTFLGNTLMSWLIFAGIIVGGFIVIRVIKYFLLKYLKEWSKKTTNSFDDFIVESFERSVVPFLYFFAVFMAFNYIDLPARGAKIVHIVMLLVTTFYVLRIITSALQYFIFSFLKMRDDGEVKQKQAKGLIVIVKAVIWILGIIFILDNLGYNVTTIIAGLGIGGIAIALAAQAILGDLFSYFVILFDRPFEIGDFIIVDEKSGVIEYIGVKTTRIRTLGGEQLVCSNKDLTDSRVHNYKRMEKRRIVFNLGVTYQTAPAVIEKIPGIVKDIITKADSVTYDRGHFSGFGDFSLNFEFVYYILTSDYSVFMDKQQEIYCAILKRFNDDGIDFAYPTQTLFVSKEAEQVQ